MTDLGKLFFEKERAFECFQIHQIVINPEVENYPPVFLNCSSGFASEASVFLIGLTFLQLNTFLMKVVENQKRLLIAEKLADLILADEDFNEIDLKELTGSPLTICGIQLRGKARCFTLDKIKGKKALYYFQIADL